MQIGNPITEKKVLDVVLARARRRPVHTPSPTAAPAASHRPSARWAQSSAREVQLERVPLKYAGLAAVGDLALRGAGAHGAGGAAGQAGTRCSEILRRAGRRGDASSAQFTGDGRLRAALRRQRRGRPVACEFLHDGIPRRELQAMWSHSARQYGRTRRQWRSLLTAR